MYVYEMDTGAKVKYFIKCDFVQNIGNTSIIILPLISLCLLWHNEKRGEILFALTNYQCTRTFILYPKIH